MKRGEARVDIAMRAMLLLGSYPSYPLVRFAARV